MKLKVALSFIGSAKQHGTQTMLRSLVRNAAIAGRNAQRQRDHAERSALWLASFYDNGDLAHVELDDYIKPETVLPWAGPFLRDQRSNE